MKGQRTFLAALILLCLSAAAGRSEQVAEVWRSPFGRPRAVSVNRGDGSCWAATGNSVMHLAPDGSVLSQTNGFRDPCAVSVNTTDGSCWVADTVHDEVVHLSSGGQELWRGEGFSWPRSISVNPRDGSCWVADAYNRRVVHLSASGQQLSEHSLSSVPLSVSVNSSDGSCWVGTYVYGSAADGRVLHLSATGGQLSSSGDFFQPVSLSVNPNDGSCWVAETGSKQSFYFPTQIVHLSAGGGELWRGEPFPYKVSSVSVDPTDNSCWVAGASTLYGGDVLHLSAGHQQLWWGQDFGYLAGVSASDGTCWVADYGNNKVVHLSADGTQLWRGGGYSLGRSPQSVAANSSDGSCWVADTRNSQVVKLAADGTELVRRGGFNLPQCVSVNSTDGSCWVADTQNSQVVKLAADGTELVRRGGFFKPDCVSVNHIDGSCWYTGFESSQVVHVSAEGSYLGAGPCQYPSSISASPMDGSCWIGGTWDGASHLSAAGELLWQGPSEDVSSVSANASDGSCWIATEDYLWHRSAEHGVLPGWSGQDSQISCVSANPADGSCWVAELDDYDLYSGLVHLSALGEVLYRGGDMNYPTSLSVNQADGSVWVADQGAQQVVHLARYTFPDVPPGQWAWRYVESAVTAGIVGGYSDGLYHPEISVTRDQMAVYIARALVAPTGEAALADYVPASPRNFPDVPGDFWAYKHIEYCAEQNVVAGYDDGLYHPEYEVTRDQMAVYVARAMVAPTGEAALADYVPSDPRNFPDVPSTGYGDDGTDPFWAYKHIEYCVENGVVAGYLDGSYQPEWTVTRDQMAVYVARAFDLVD